jgi:aspartyl-tRNA(Asn)/glutamyl-tRNA(Gln) amidotransferase subunit B
MFMSARLTLRGLALQAQLAKLRAELPELPEDAFDRLRSQYGLSAREAGILVALGERMDDAPETEGGENLTGLGVRWFEEVAKGREAKVAANW